MIQWKASSVSITRAACATHRRQPARRRVTSAARAVAALTRATVSLANTPTSPNASAAKARLAIQHQAMAAAITKTMGSAVYGS